MLYTIVPSELILQEEPPLIESGEINGISCDVIRMPGGSRRIARIYSTDLRDYLNPYLMPGHAVQLKSPFDEIF